MFCTSKARIHNWEVSHIKSQINCHLLFMPGTLRPYQRQIKNKRIPHPIYQKHTHTHTHLVGNTQDIVNSCKTNETHLLHSQMTKTVPRSENMNVSVICDANNNKTRCLWRESEDIRFLFTSMRSVIRFFESKFLIILIILLAQNTVSSIWFYRALCCACLSLAESRREWWF